MEPTSKRICDHVAADDRLSDLPDCLIHNILSFLESRQAVQSSMLSRRWRHLWRSVPSLDIDQTVFRRRVCCRNRECRKRYYGENRACKKEWPPFEEFGNKLMSRLHSARSLDKLRIHVPALDFDDRQAIEPCLRWISRGVQCSPTMIHIHMDFGWSWGHWYPSNNYGSFPGLGSTSSSLTRLILHGVKLDHNFVEQLRSGYHVLDELSLVRCFCRFGDIASGRIRHLNIDDCLSDGDSFDGLVVAAPRLTSLRTSLSNISLPNGIYVVDTDSFIKAAVCVTTWYLPNAGFFERLYKLLNIMHLELFGSNMMENLQRISDVLPQFHNVRTLLIDRCNLKTNANIQTLDHFLQSVPSLEKLTLQNCEFTGRSKKRTIRAKWRNVALESQNLMSFKCDNLKVIEIKHSEDDNVDELFELLMSLLKNMGRISMKLTKV